MVYNADGFSEVFNGCKKESKEGFMWFNIPENNMQWVVDLHSRICSDPKGSESDAAQIDPQSFSEWFHASRPHHLTPRSLQDSHHGSKRSIKNTFVSIPYLSVECHERRLKYEKVVNGPDLTSSQNSHLADEDDLSRYEYLTSAYGAEHSHRLVRRTLDRYLYHSLHDIARRDGSQVALRVSHGKKPFNVRDFETRLLESPEFDRFRSQWWPLDDDDDSMHGGDSKYGSDDGDVLMVDQACI